MSKKINLVGQRFGRLTVVSPAPNKGNRTTWNCVCDCGRHVVARTACLRNGESKSCGCLKKDNAKEYHTTHGGTYTRLYTIWKGLRMRCFSSTNSDFLNYGGRGITVCDEWENDFTAFRDWALSHGYREDLSIDRIDVNGNYEPSNCRWATAKEQNNNKRNSRKATLV